MKPTKTKAEELKELEETRKDIELAGYDNIQDAKFYRNIINRIAKKKAELKGREDMKKEIIKIIDEYIKSFKENLDVPQLNDDYRRLIKLKEEIEKR